MVAPHHHKIIFLMVTHAIFTPKQTVVTQFLLQLFKPFVKLGLHLVGNFATSQMQCANLKEVYLLAWLLQMLQKSVVDKNLSKTVANSARFKCVNMNPQTTTFLFLKLFRSVSFVFEQSQTYSLNISSKVEAVGTHLSFISLFVLRLFVKTLLF